MSPFLSRPAAAAAVAAAVLAPLLLALSCPRAAVAFAAPLTGGRDTKGDPRDALWQGVFARVPIALLPTRDVLVRHLSDREMDALLRETDPEVSASDRRAIQGLFFVNDDHEPTITLRENLAGEQAQMIFAHELGHAVWDTHLTPAEQQRYVAAYRQAKKQNRLVSDYAADSDYEGFAEAFAFFVLKPDVLKGRDPASFAILNTLRNGKSDKTARKGTGGPGRARRAAAVAQRPGSPAGKPSRRARRDTTVGRIVFEWPPLLPF